MFWSRTSAGASSGPPLGSKDRSGSRDLVDLRRSFDTLSSLFLLQGQKSLANAANTQPGVRLRVQWRVHSGTPLEFATLSSVHREGEGKENSVYFHSINSFTSSVPRKRLIVSRRPSHGCKDTCFLCSIFLLSYECPST